MRNRVILNADREDTSEVLAAGRSMRDGYLGDPKTFLSPNPPPALLDTLITTLDTAQQATKMRTRGAAAARDLARNALWDALQTGRTFVQVLVNQNPEQAETIVQAVSLYLAAPYARDKPLLAATQEVAGGPVALDANATLLRGEHKKGVAVTYHWRHSLDRGKSWILDESTPHATTEISGLPADTEVWVEVRATHGKDKGEWSHPVILMVR
jgi:hypothetical protein